MRMSSVNMTTKMLKKLIHELVVHKQCDYKVNENVKYPCNQCEYKATTKGNLKTHTLSVHMNVK